jgi:hypothetical protein
MVLLELRLKEVSKGCNRLKNVKKSCRGGPCARPLFG